MTSIPGLAGTLAARVPFSPSTFYKQACSIFVEKIYPAMNKLTADANPLLQLRSEHIKKPVFKRHHSDRYKRLETSWRKPRGLDNRMRKKHKGCGALPGKRYKKPAIVRFLLPNGLRPLPVRNVEDLYPLTTLNRRYCATIHHAVGAMKRIAIINEARRLGVCVTNERGRLIDQIPEQIDVEQE